MKIEILIIVYFLASSCKRHTSVVLIFSKTADISAKILYKFSSEQTKHFSLWLRGALSLGIPNSTATLLSLLASTGKLKDYLNVSNIFKCRNTLTFAFIKALFKYVSLTLWIICFSVIFL